MDKTYYPACVKITLPAEFEQFGLESEKIRLEKNDKSDNYRYVVPIGRETILAKFETLIDLIRSRKDEDSFHYELDFFNNVNGCGLHIANSDSLVNGLDDLPDTFHNFVLAETPVEKLLEWANNPLLTDANSKHELLNVSMSSLIGVTFAIVIDSEYVGEHLLESTEEQRDEVYHESCIKAVLPASLTPLGMGLTRVTFVEDEDPNFVHTLELSRQQVLEHFDAIMEHVRKPDIENDLDYILEAEGPSALYRVDKDEVVFTNYPPGNPDDDVCVPTIQATNDDVKCIIESEVFAASSDITYKLIITIEHFDVIAATEELKKL